MRDESRVSSGFVNRLMRLLDSVEYRRIESREDLEAVARVRYNAYDQIGLAPKTGTVMIDEEDFASNAHVIGIYYDERLVSTIRVHHVTQKERTGLATACFPDVMDPLLDAGRTFIDPVRFAADPKVLRELPGIPYLTLRIATMATDYFATDYCLSVIKPNHKAFYQRIFNSKPLIKPRYLERFDSMVELYGSDAHSELQRIYQRFGFFNSTAMERRMMFAPVAVGRTPVLTVRPTARFAMARAH
ncbi:N-acyl amino acid synthase FeeM domain-containing protein [Pseudohoeflea coraliihabitans]|uniref:N-acyl amino acid synthase FeeM catalytic core domain-containing protein n=1 Tax=Pseudohoeflea coraliihabitans TaxID=2860393 RepID=A0ABS6WK87_9HYPH|nr:hypothetical protein [Pseudohoeflea sp. DP4N28-3]MBW3096366.1 hypothetical protein [Pseudohoeflea sp. DP4N28-3]